MNSICRLCGSENRYDEYHRLYKPCDSFNTKPAIKNYYNFKDKILEKKRKFLSQNKEFFDNYN